MADRTMLLKVLILGESGVGKTSVLKRYVNNKYSSQYKATIGVSFMTKEIYINNIQITLQIWDTAGQERFQSLSNTFYRGADCCILVHDITNARTLYSLETWKNKILDFVPPHEQKSFPFILLSNKSDLADKMNIVTEKQISDWCKENQNIPHFKVSAKDGTDINFAFQTIVEQVVINDKKQSGFYLFPDAVSLKDIELEDTKKCC